MSTKQDILDDIAELGTDVAAEIQAVSDKIAALQAQGGGVTASDLDDIKAALDAVKTKVTDETAALTTPPTP